MTKRLSGFVAAAVFVAVLWNGGGPAAGASQGQAPGLTADGLSAIAFRSLPTNVVTGRVQDIEIDPKNSNVWYVATAFGPTLGQNDARLDGLTEPDLIGKDGPARQRRAEREQRGFDLVRVQIDARVGD